MYSYKSRFVGQIIMTDRAPELLQLRVRNPVWVHDTTRKNVEKTLLYCSSGSTFIFIHCESYSDSDCDSDTDQW